jgi:hypothetical protein
VNVNRRVVLGILAVLVLALLAGSIGTAVYNAGVHAGLADAAQQAAASGDPVAVPAYGYGPYWHGGWGFGFFGIIFWILGIFLVIGLVRGALGWGRGRGPGGYGGYGGWRGPGDGGRREMVEEWHREMHRREAGTGDAPGA